MQVSRILAASAIVLLFAPYAQPCHKKSIHLDPKEMRGRIVKRTPMLLQGHHVRIAGNIELLVVVDKEGKPACISVVRGHPLLTSVAIFSVKDWRFLPYSSNDKRKEYSGFLVLESKEFAVPE